jgi:hypothetical protein
LLCRTTPKKRFLLGSQMLSGAIGLLIESCLQINATGENP